MTSDTKILDELIKDDVKILKMGNVVELRDSVNKKSAVPIYGMPDDVIIIRADVFPAPSEIFKCKKKECRRADFIVISEQRKIIIYIEIFQRNSRRNKSKQYIIEQLMGAECCMEYCRAVVKKFWKKEKFLSGYQNFYVNIKIVSINKKPTRNKYSIPDASKCDTPECFRRIASLPQQTLEFKRLVS